jgi:gamma-glutamylaminecyclotransferase
MATHLFVFGTLKQGFGNFHINRGRRVAGEFVTVLPHPLFIVGPRHLPWLLQRPGEGLPVRGQVFEVDADALAAMDRLERIDEPDWYLRRHVMVRDAGDAHAAALQAWVYFGSESGMAGRAVHAGPLDEYTQELAARFPVNVT